MAQLTDAERAQVKTAHDAAIQQDPALEQKMNEIRKSMEAARKELQDAMIKIDPTLEPILAKITAPKLGRKHEDAPDQSRKGNGKRAGDPTQAQNGEGMDQAKPARHKAPAGMADLTEAERQQLRSLHEQVKNDPTVTAALEAKKNASTPEARQATEEALRKATHDAMIKADPSIEAILEKLHSGGDAKAATTPVPQR